MKTMRQMAVELPSEDIEKMMENYAKEILESNGYELDYSRNESETPFPDMRYRGIKIEDKDA